MHELYLMQDTSRLGTARVKPEEEADTRIIAVVRNLDVNNVDTKKKSSKQGLTLDEEDRDHRFAQIN